MKTITAYRERTGRLRYLIDTLKASHEQLFNLRSESWHEQMRGELDRASRLDDLHERIFTLEGNIEQMRGELGLPPTPTGPI